MSLNHIVSENPEIEDIALNVTFNNIKILGDITSNNETQEFANIEWRNSNDSDIKATSTIIFYKIGRVCTMFISGFTSADMGTGGKLYTNFLATNGVPEKYRPFLGQNANFPLLKTRNSVSPVFDSCVELNFDSATNYFFITNNTNSGNFPADQNVIIRNVFITYFTNDTPLP